MTTTRYDLSFTKIELYDLVAATNLLKHRIEQCRDRILDDDPRQAYLARQLSEVADLRAKLKQIVKDIT